MVNYRFINRFSALLTILIYLLVLFFVYLISKDDIKSLKDYGQNVKNSIIINLDNISELDTKSKNKKNIKKIVKISKNHDKKSKADSRDKEQNDIKNLFSTTKVDKDANEIEEKLKKEKTRASRLKKIDAKELFKSQALDDSEIKKELLSIKKILNKKNSSKKRGKYDEKFLQKISSIITTKWQNTIATKDGLKASVIIRIDKNGHFFYRNLKSSFNNIFDAKLKRFLDNLTKMRFPKYKNGKYIEVEFLFADKEEL